MSTGHERDDSSGKRDKLALRSQILNGEGQLDQFWRQRSMQGVHCRNRLFVNSVEINNLSVASTVCSLQ